MSELRADLQRTLSWRACQDSVEPTHYFGRGYVSLRNGDAVAAEGGGAGACRRQWVDAPGVPAKVNRK